jgi:hypothetical protein
VRLSRAVWAALETLRVSPSLEACQLMAQLFMVHGPPDRVVRAARIACVSAAVSLSFVLILQARVVEAMYVHALQPPRALLETVAAHCTRYGLHDRARVFAAELARTAGTAPPEHMDPVAAAATQSASAADAGRAAAAATGSGGAPVGSGGHDDRGGRRSRRSKRDDPGESH